MKMSRIALSISLLAGLAAQQQATAFSLLSKEFAAVAFVTTSVVLFKQREPKKDAKSRFDFEKLKNIEWAKENPQEWAKQFWFFYYDVIIGQGHKSKKMVWDNDAKAIVQKEECVPFGFMGKHSGLLKVSKESYDMLKGIVFIGIAVKAFKDGSTDKIFAHFQSKAEEDLGLET